MTPISIWSASFFWTKKEGRVNGLLQETILELSRSASCKAHGRIAEDVLLKFMPHKTRAEGVCILFHSIHFPHEYIFGRTDKSQFT